MTRYEAPAPLPKGSRWQELVSRDPDLTQKGISHLLCFILTLLKRVLIGNSALPSSFERKHKRTA